MRLNALRKKMGMLEVGAASDGSTLYLAESDEDTSGFYPVGSDAYGNTLYSENPGAQVSSGLSDQIANIASSLTAIYQAKTLTDINAQRMRSGQPPLNQSQTASLSPNVNVGLNASTQNMILIGVVALAIVWFMKNDKN
jgi:hypothetical protein